MSRIVVIGASNNDIVLRTDKKAVLHDSNPGTMKVTDGGVGRNITETLARLGHDVTFMTALAEDEPGRRIRKNLELLSVNVINERVQKTPVYAAIMDDDGDLVCGVADMDGITRLGPSLIKAHAKTIIAADLLVVDANLSQDALEAVFQVSTGLPVHADGISTAKVMRLKPFLDRFAGLKVNRMEAATLTGLSADSAPDTLAQTLLDTGLRRVFLSLGQDGVMIGDHAGIRAMKPIVTDVKNTSGAGDALFSGIMHGLLEGHDPLVSGLVLAGLVVQSDDTVPTDLTLERFTQTMKDVKP
jgi:pseudouridine kinase